MKVILAIVALVLLTPHTLYGEEGKAKAVKDGAKDKAKTEKVEKVEVELEEDEAVKETPVEKAEPKQSSFQQDTFFSGSMEGVEHGGYGALTASWGKVLDKDARFMGARGGWIVNHGFTLGMGGYGMVNDMDAPNDSLDRQLNMGYGGLNFGYTFASTRRVHVHTNLLVGAGGINISEKSWRKVDDDDDDDDDDSLNDAFSVFEPEVLVEMNITKWFRIGAGVTYRYVNGVNVKDIEIEDKDFSGANAILALKFGIF